jgi:tetratricopeptide (TPR) repeat protein
VSAWAKGWILIGGLALAACGPSAGERARDHLTRGRALAAEGKHEAAVAELRKAVEADRDSIEAYTELGNAYRALKQYERAIEAYRAAKKIDRYVTRPHLENARALVETGEVDQAIDQLNHVVELDPKNLEVLVLLGRVSMMPRRLPDGSTGVPAASLERAELNLEAAAGMAPDSLPAQHGLALAREKLGKTAEARQAWARVRDLAARQPEQATVAAEATEALARLGR